MARYGNSITKTTTAAAVPICTLSTGSGRDARIFEIGVFATTAVAGEVGLMRPANSPATPSGGQVGVALDNVSAAGVAVTGNAWATAPTASTGLRRVQLPATIGAGVIWTFPTGIVLPVSSFFVVWQFSTAIVGYDVYFDYDE